MFCKYQSKLQTTQILSGNFVHKVELENSRLPYVNDCTDVGPKLNIKKR